MVIGSKRAYCSQCLRPKKGCFCHCVVPVASLIEVVIWQHPSEQSHPKGTAQLLHLCLPNSRLISQEQATAEDLGLKPAKVALLYPKDHQKPENSPSHVMDVQQLLVLDGTWRKSRKMLHLNPWVLDLPRIHIQGAPSLYSIRKAESSSQLSTFEAVAFALEQLEPGRGLAQLHQSFNQYMAHLQRFIPSQLK